VPILQRPVLFRTSDKAEIYVTLALKTLHLSKKLSIQLQLSTRVLSWAMRGFHHSRQNGILPCDTLCLAAVIGVTVLSFDSSKLFVGASQVPNYCGYTFSKEVASAPSEIRRFSCLDLASLNLYRNFRLPC
jgi:hypothetical protein